MTAKYADDPDVQHLVSIIQSHCLTPSVSMSDGTVKYHIHSVKAQDIRAALQPFLPDPEEELIKKMVNAYVREPSSFSVKINMVKVLDAIKEAGWRAPDHD